jgi:tetratricopeptide (TPR) repeat protein
MQIPSLLSKCILSFLIPAIVTQPLHGMHDTEYLKSQSYKDPLNVSKQISYDEVLKYLENIESGALEKVSNEKDLEAINTWLIYLARAGVIPGDLEAESLLEADIEELSEDALGFEYAFLEDDAEFMLIPNITPHRFEAFVCKSWLSKKWKQTKKFIKEHKKEILIGAAIVVGAVVVVAAVTASAGSAVAAAGAAAISDKNKPKSSDVIEQASTIRDDVLTKDLVNLQDKNFPIEENARILGQASAQIAFERLQNSISCSTFFSSDLEKMGGLSPESCHLIDQAFAKPIPWYSWDYSNSFKENVYAARGSYALDIKSFDQAFSDFEKALKLNPSNSDVYLKRALTYFETGQMDKATADFKKHVELRPEPIKDMKDFSIGFAKGALRGIKDSGTGLLEFSGDLVCHPISTCMQMYESGKMLFELTKSAEWKEIAHCLSPEAYELATEWECLSFERRGELSGYVFGKHGADFLLPGVGINIAKGALAKSKLLLGAMNAASRTDRVYVLESVAAGTGKIADASFGVKTASGIKDLGELGFIKHIEHLNTNQMFNFAEAPLKHMQEPGRWVPMRLMKEVIEHPIASMPDPRQVTKANMYYSQISRNGKLYNIEILYDAKSNTIYHFKYDPGPLGPLKKASLYEK